jgi:hypothetical protein
MCEPRFAHRWHIIQRAAGVIYFVVGHVSSDISLDILYDISVFNGFDYTNAKRTVASYQNKSETTFLHSSVPVELFFTSDPFANSRDA